MSEARLETFLATIYTHETARARFLTDPRGEAIRAGLSTQEIEDLVNIDREGLELFANSLEHKKAQKDGNQKNQHPKRAKARRSLFTSDGLQRLGLRRWTTLNRSRNR